MGRIQHLAGLIAGSVSAVRVQLPFDYGWQFHLGDPEGAQPPLTAASVDQSFSRNISNHTCSNMAYAARRPVLEDCRGICATTPGCLAWQYGTHYDVNSRGSFNSCFIHDPSLGDTPVCTPGLADNSSSLLGESRSAEPPPLQQRAGVAFKESAFDDSGWETVNAPHDFIVRGYYDQSAALKHGYLPRNVSAWYRKPFRAPAAWAGGATWLHFEGAFQVCDVFLNGVWVVRHRAGYLGFDVRLDNVSPGLLRTGSAAAAAPNVLAVRVDASFGSGHWYEGGGLTRRVHLLHTPTTLRFAPGGLFAQTEASSVPATGVNATVAPTAEVVADVSASVSVCYTVVDRTTDSAVARACTPVRHIAPQQQASSTRATVVDGATLVVAAAQLWSVRAPSLYTLTAALVDASTNTTVDAVNTTIGLRHIDWQAEGGGFALNGEPVQLRGFSHHEDFGGVGVAVPDRLNLFRANALRSLGGNIWRTSHNPYTPPLYDILDALGVLVWDENREFTARNTEDMEELVRRDRNHAAVIVWSACNEIECVVSGGANDTGRLMREATKRWDTTRPFGANCWYNQHDQVPNLAHFADVEGFSHSSVSGGGGSFVKEIHADNPGKAVVSSECCSCTSQRGEDVANASAGVSYPHSLAQAQCLEGCMKHSYPYWRGNPSPVAGVVAGTLGVWTLFDYGGEPGPWPLVASSFGQFDMAGFAKSASYWYRSLWLAAAAADDPGRPPLPATHVVRVSQTWNANAAAPLPPQMDVQVFSDLPLIELVLNGESLGSAPCAPGGFASFSNVTYAPGNLTAVGRQSAGERVLGSHTQLAAGAPASIELSLDAPSVATGTGSALLLDGHDAAMVRATVRDASGRIVDGADNLLTFAVKTGPGRVVGVHNGDAKSHEPQIATSRRAYHGLARAVVKVTVDAASVAPAHLELLATEVEVGGGAGRIVIRHGGDADEGPIVVTATSPGLASGEVTIPVSTDAGADSVLAVAAASTQLDLTF